MRAAVHWMAETTIKDGQLDNLKAVMKDMVEAVQTEPGTTHYEWFIGDDKKTCHIYERYADSAAVLTHLAGFGRFADRLLATITVNRVVLYGDASAEVREGMGAFDPVRMTQIGGFAR